MNILKLLSIAAVAALAACATVPTVPAPHACDAVPNRILTDAKGAPTRGLYFCYEATGAVSYETRLLTLEQLAALTAAAAPAPKAEILAPASVAPKKKHGPHAS